MLCDKFKTFKKLAINLKFRINYGYIKSENCERFWVKK